MVTCTLQHSTLLPADPYEVWGHWILPYKTKTNQPTKTELKKRQCSFKVLDRTLQNCKPCSCPALRPKKEPGDNDRDVNGLVDRGPNTPKTKGPGATPHHVR